MPYLKKLIYKLPKKLQFEAKRIYYFYLIKTGKFTCDEIEYKILDKLISPGDWALDIGANIGHYTAKLSQLVGPTGRVIAFEPFPDTFSLLSSNCNFSDQYKNITLINAAASNNFEELSMELPLFENGTDNYYQARITDGVNGLDILCIPAGVLNYSNEIKLVKVDAEGHDFNVIQGLKNILQKDRPLLVIEENTDEMRKYLDDLDYKPIKLKDSHNTIYVCSNRYKEYRETLTPET